MCLPEGTCQVLTRRGRGKHQPPLHSLNISQPRQWQAGMQRLHPSWGWRHRAAAAAAAVHSQRGLRNDSKNKRDGRHKHATCNSITGWKWILIHNNNTNLHQGLCSDFTPNLIDIISHFWDILLTYRQTNTDSLSQMALSTPTEDPGRRGSSCELMPHIGLKKIHCSLKILPQLHSTSPTHVYKRGEITPLSNSQRIFCKAASAQTGGPCAQLLHGVWRKFGSVQLHS